MKNVHYRLITVSVLLSLAASCAVDTAGPGDDGDALRGDGDDDAVGSISSPILKGLPGATNGDRDYCKGEELCVSGEGDCDGSIECSVGTVCAMNKGAQFGFAANIDVCLPAHCTNRRIDGNETQPDCGGSCGATCAPHACAALPVGHDDKCVAGACICTQGQGDCDSIADCAPGLACIMNNGPNFGMGATQDVCAPAHCGNRMMDGNETSIDCGGSCGTVCSAPSAVLLGSAANYVILAKSAISTVPSSAITGDVGLSPAAASFITGFSMTRVGTHWTSPQVVGSLFAADNDPPTPSNLTTAIGDMETAYTDAAGRARPNFLNLASGAIGGRTLPPGLYRWTSGVTVSADITLSGGPNDVWIFQITGNLLMSAAQAMTLDGGAQAKNVFWQVAGAVDFGTGAHAEGIVLSKTAIKLGAGASINGRLLAQTAVDLDSSTVVGPAL